MKMKCHTHHLVSGGSLGSIWWQWVQHSEQAHPSLFKLLTTYPAWQVKQSTFSRSPAYWQRTACTNDQTTSTVTLKVTVTEVLILCHLLVDWGCIAKQVILFPVYVYTHTHTHTHNHFTALWTLSGTTRVSWYQKVHFAIFWIFWCKMKITQADAQTEMISVHDKMRPSIAAISAMSAAWSTLMVRQQKKQCRKFVDVSAAQWSV